MSAPKSSLNRLTGAARFASEQFFSQLRAKGPYNAQCALHERYAVARGGVRSHESDRLLHPSRSVSTSPNSVHRGPPCLAHTASAALRHLLLRPSECTTRPQTPTSAARLLASRHCDRAVAVVRPFLRRPSRSPSRRCTANAANTVLLLPVSRVMEKQSVPLSLFAPAPPGPYPPSQVVGVPPGTILVPPHTQNATQEVEHMSWFGEGWIPRSTPLRMIVTFYPADCCKMGGGGFNGEQEPAVQAMLMQRGGPEAVARWEAAKQALARDLLGRCCVFGNVVLCMTGLGIPVVCYMEAKRQRVLRIWLAHANGTVFSPLGCFCKFQTVTIVRQNGDGSSREEEYSWLAIALHPGEVGALQSEPIFWRPAGCCQPKIGPDCCAGSKCCCCEPRCV